MKQLPLRSCSTAILAAFACFACSISACSGSSDAAAASMGMDASDASAAASPDGDSAETANGGTVISTAQIVYMAPIKVSTLGALGSEIVVMNLDGSGKKQITDNERQEFLPHFSPDGTRLVYTVFEKGSYGSRDAVTDIAIYDFATGTEKLITRTGDATQGVFSPDGKRIAYLGSASVSDGGAVQGSGIWIVDAADGSHPQKVGSPDGSPEDHNWGDIAWSTDDWIMFVVAHEDLTNGNCFKVRTDKIRPDGTSRIKMSDGGPNCTPDGMESSGDADPGFSADGKTVYSSRGFPVGPANGPPGQTERKLYAFTSDAWSPGKIEQDLSLPSQPSCIEGVPKGAPDGKRVLLFRRCFGSAAKPGIYVTDTAGSYRTFVVADGFGPDWNPVAR